MRHMAANHSLGHVDSPDAGAAAQVENAGRPMLRDRGLVQVFSPCNEEQLVVDVHAVLLGLVARIHVETASEAMVEAAVLLVVVRSRNNQPARLGQRVCAVRCGAVRASAARGGGREVAPSGGRAALTHLKPS